MHEFLFLATRRVGEKYVKRVYFEDEERFSDEDENITLLESILMKGRENVNICKSSYLIIL